ncbi:MAG: ROK family protein [bacterium]
MRNVHVVAVDLGGTNVRFALVSPRGKVMRRRRLAMPGFRRPDDLYDWLAGAIEAFGKTCGASARPRAVGVGFAGPADSARGLVHYAPNVGGLVNLEIAAGLERRVGLPVIVENDANCAALGEFWRGAGRGSASLFMFTVGTGIGGSFLIGGRVWRGADGLAGEIGHTVVAVGGPRCSCGKAGCLEALVSATAIVREYSVAAGVGLSAGRPITAKEVFDRARRGDRRARRVVDGAARALGVGIANVFHLLNPEIILVGGGVSRAGRALMDPAREEARRMVFAPLRDRLSVRRAMLGDDAGVVGAAFLALGGGAAGRSRPRARSRLDGLTGDPGCVS